MTTGIEVGYAGTISVQLDACLDQLATEYGGEWSASGVGVRGNETERDIEFCFETENAARTFANACKQIGTVRVLSIAEDSE